MGMQWNPNLSGISSQPTVSRLRHSVFSVPVSTYSNQLTINRQKTLQTGFKLSMAGLLLSAANALLLIASFLTSRRMAAGVFQKGLQALPKASNYLFLPVSLGLAGLGLTLNLVANPIPNWLQNRLTGK